MLNHDVYTLVSVYQELSGMSHLSKNIRAKRTQTLMEKIRPLAKSDDPDACFLMSNCCTDPNERRLWTKISAHQGNLSAMCMMFKNHIDIYGKHGCDKDLDQALYYLVMYQRHVDIIDQDEKCKSESAEEILRETGFSEHIDKLQSLLNESAVREENMSDSQAITENFSSRLDFSAKTDEENAYLDAVKAGDFKVVEKYLDEGGNPFVTAEASALHLAIENDQMQIFKQLLELHLKYDFYLDSLGGRSFLSPVACAMAYDRPEYVSLLLEAGADPHRKNDTEKNAFSYRDRKEAEKVLYAFENKRSETLEFHIIPVSYENDKPTACFKFIGQIPERERIPFIYKQNLEPYIEKQTPQDQDLKEYWENQLIIKFIRSKFKDEIEYSMTIFESGYSLHKKLHPLYQKYVITKLDELLESAGLGKTECMGPGYHLGSTKYAFTAEQLPVIFSFLFEHLHRTHAIAISSDRAPVGCPLYQSATDQTRQVLGNVSLIVYEPNQESLPMLMNQGYLTLVREFLSGTELALVKLFEAQETIKTMKSRDDIPVIIELLKEVQEIKKSVSYSEKLEDKFQEICMALWSGCLNLEPSETEQDKKTNIATAIACSLAVRKELNVVTDDYKNLLLQLVGLGMDKAGLLIEVLKQEYPKQYHNAWAAINRQYIDLFYNGDTFTNREFVSQRDTRSLSVITNGNSRYVFWQHKLPQTDSYKAQDDNQRTRDYVDKPARSMEI